MAKKRANGEGNIRKRKDGRWEGRYTAGYDEKTGKRITKSVLGKTQAEVKEKLAKAVAEAETVDVRRADAVSYTHLAAYPAQSRPARGAWIEISRAISLRISALVAPRKGRVD